LTINLIFIY